VTERGTTLPTKAATRSVPGLVLSAALASWAAIEALAPRASIAWLVWPSDADAGPWLRSACLLSAAAAIAGTALHRRRACLAFVPGFILSVGHGVWTLFDGTWSLSHSSYDHAWWGFAPLTLPTSLVVAPGVALALVHPRARWLVAISSVLLVPLIVLFHAAIREPARDIDAVVVLGAGVAPDGTPSAALRDRVTTGVSIATTTGAMLVVVGAGEGLASEPRDRHRAVDGASQRARPVSRLGAHTGCEPWSPPGAAAAHLSPARAPLRRNGGVAARRARGRAVLRRAGRGCARLLRSVVLARRAVDRRQPGDASDR
jgi:hypothetical protein